ncbi:formimidoylglutamase [Speluncibacter jeojiensis]|uniref:Formimidoylglutamase n=1 Tax=Speluncibacter jeojiensis TaxID=2710754 RepID=A0A9X4M2Y5_9ACTN|nr:formimidoylglutamase [Corynebacteriales bacterium D3-21]
MSARPPRRWTGRDDGAGPEHLRWHHVVEPYSAVAAPADGVVVGFRSDEGVRRNQGRVGAAAGPDALRSALASLALPGPLRLYDAGDIEVSDGRLEPAQRELGDLLTGLLDGGQFPVVLGGGHEVAYASYLGWSDAAEVHGGARVAVLNLDAHFDLRDNPIAGSGTPFRQMADDERGRGRSLDYAVIGIAEPSNTRALFDAAGGMGARYLLDDECEVDAVDAFVDRVLGAADLVHLSIDLDVLPAAVAPGVSAPAAFGVPPAVVQRACDRVARSGKLALCEVAELNPSFDVDGRTARSAARLVHRIVTGRSAPRA